MPSQRLVLKPYFQRKWLPIVDTPGQAEVVDGKSWVWVYQAELPEKWASARKNVRREPEVSADRKPNKPPSLRERALALVKEQGTVRTKDLEASGIPRQYPRMMCREGLLEYVSFGVYGIVKASDV